MEEIKNDFAIAFQIINCFDKETFDRIPKDLYKKIEKIAHQSKTKFRINKHKKLEEQNIPKGAKIILKYILMNIKNSV